MMQDALLTHLSTGATHVCHCWSVVRRDGQTFGFTDHDLPIQFDGITFAPESGLSARALASTTGLAVDNTEAMGVLSSAAITEADIAAGRYDGAAVTVWLVQWDDPVARRVRFRGSIGEITRAGGAFQAELRGLAEALNQLQGRSYLKTCSAVLGDAGCRFNVDNPAHSILLDVVQVDQAQLYRFTADLPFNEGWFDSGLLHVQSGAAEGLSAVIKSDVTLSTTRTITLWDPIRADVVPGDRIRLVAGCDKRAETCRLKFNNMLNFQGFPDIPGEDWLMRAPGADG
ncbi:DUF2163 domain-containing protein [Loktanella agnita]|uniref:DUF2163 domain-containing protein n=1 Tax=Loktanella agnita TaxID=287097 RepID=UPI0039857521